MLGALATVPSAQAPVHLNRLIETLAQGRGELINAVFTRGHRSIHTARSAITGVATVPGVSASSLLRVIPLLHLTPGALPHLKTAFAHYLRATSGLANLPASIGTFGRTSVSLMVDCPFVQVMIQPNGILTPATSR